MDPALILSAVLLGLAGTPHCAAMCAAPCAAASGPKPTGALVFQAARVAGYALAGAVAAGSVSALASLSQFSAAFKPLWALLHAGVLSLGLWMLWQARQPAWMLNIARSPAPAPATGWQPMLGPLRAGAAGALWVAWPCGLLQSALVVAALASTPSSGALAMAGFALASSGGLLAAPWLWARLARGGSAQRAERGLARLAGAMLVLGSGFALTEGVWHQVAAFCGLA